MAALKATLIGDESQAFNNLHNFLFAVSSGDESAPSFFLELGQNLV